MKWALGLFLLAAWPGPVWAKLRWGIKDTDTPVKCVELDDTTIYRFKADCSEWLERTGVRFFVRHNRLALRGPDYSPGFSGTRILFAGSSILAGPGLEESRTIPAVLEEELKRRVGNVQVLNGGYEGFSSLQSAIVLPELLAAYRPGMVLYWLTFGGETMRDAIYAQALVERDGYPAAIHSVLGTGLIDRYVEQHRRERFFLFRALFTWNFFFRRAVTTWGCKWKSKTERELGECLGAGTFAGVAAMQRLASAKGIPYYVVYPGEGYQAFTELTINPIFVGPIANALEWIIPDVSVHTDTLLRILRDKGIRVIYLPKYRQLLRYYFSDDHPNEKGAEQAAHMLAEQLAPLLEKRGPGKK